MNVELRHQIHDYFAYVDEKQGSVDLAAVRGAEGIALVDELDRFPDPPRRSKRGWLIAAAAFLVVVAVVAVPMLLTRSGPAPPVNTIPSSTNGTMIQNQLELSWTLTTTPSNTPRLEQLFFRGGVVSTPTGLLAIDDAIADSLVRSVDGGRWERVPSPIPIRLGAKLHTVGNAYLLASHDGRVFSTFDGTTWTEENADEFPDLTSTIRFLGFDLESLKALDVPREGTEIHTSHVIKLDDRVLAFEHGDNSKGVARAYTSPDGVNWVNLDVPHLDDLDLVNSEAFAVSDGVLVVSGRSDSSGRNRTTLLRTTDGFSWTNVTPPYDDFDAQGIVATDSGWIAGGNQPGQVYSSRVYFSANGLTWTEIEIFNDPFAAADHVHLFVAGDIVFRATESFRDQYQFASLETLSSP